MTIGNFHISYILANEGKQKFAGKQKLWKLYETAAVNTLTQPKETQDDWQTFSETPCLPALTKITMVIVSKKTENKGATKTYKYKYVHL